MSGGAGMIELRDREHPRNAIERSGQTFRRLANTYGALFIVNDDPYLAHELARRRGPRGPGRHRPGGGAPDHGPGRDHRPLHPQPRADRGRREQPIDYISVGPIWETPTKEGRPATGLELIGEAAEIATRPWFAIGGINTENADEVASAGAERLCVVRAIRDAENPRAAATTLFGAVDPAARAERGG